MRMRLNLLRNPSAPGIARDRVEQTFRGSAGDRAVSDLMLVVSELVTNAIVHGVGPVSLTAQLIGPGIRVEVSDAGTGLSRTLPVQSKSMAGGHGLRLVDALAVSWGVCVGKSCVWADMPVH